MSGLLSMPSHVAKGIAPIYAAAVWAIGRNYALVEWTVLLVSLVSCRIRYSEPAHGKRKALHFADGMQLTISKEGDCGLPRPSSS